MSNSFFLLCSLLFSPLKARYSNTQLFLDHDGRNQVHVLKETASTFGHVNVCDSKLEQKIKGKWEKSDWEDKDGYAKFTADELTKEFKCYRDSLKYMGTKDLTTADKFYNKLEEKLHEVWTGLNELPTTIELATAKEIKNIFDKAQFPIVDEAVTTAEHKAVKDLYNHILKLNTEKEREEFLKTEIGFFSMDEFQQGIVQVITDSVREAVKLKNEGKIDAVVVAVPLGNHGGDTQSCNKDAKYRDLVCKSSLWVLAHVFPLLRDEFKEAAISIEFLFFTNYSDSFQAYDEEKTTMRWNLLDATYSGSEAEELTKETTETKGSFIRTLIAVGNERTGLPMCQDDQDRNSKPESKVQSAACIRIGKTWTRDTNHKIPYATRTSAHFYVAWKCADKKSTGWAKEAALNIIGTSPYAKGHSTLATWVTTESTK